MHYAGLHTIGARRDALATDVSRQMCVGGDGGGEQGRRLGKQRGGHGGVLCSINKTRRQLRNRRRGSVSARLLLPTPTSIPTPLDLRVLSDRPCLVPLRRDHTSPATSFDPVARQGVCLGPVRSRREGEQQQNINHPSLSLGLFRLFPSSLFVLGFLIHLILPLLWVAHVVRLFLASFAGALSCPSITLRRCLAGLSPFDSSLTPPPLPPPTHTKSKERQGNDERRQ